MQRDVVWVTGCNGYIGRALVARLAGRFDVVGFDNEDPARSLPLAHFERIDLEGAVQAPIQRAAAARGNRLASVVHLAAFYDFTGRPDPRYERVNVRGSRRLLEGLAEAGVSAGQFVYASTTLVHRPCRPGERVTEDSPIDPKWAYPESKLRAERILGLKHGGVPLVILRVAGVYDDEGHSLPVSHQIHHIYERWLTSHVFPGDPDRGQPFVHLDDLLDAIVRTIERRAELPPDLTLLIGEPETMTFREIQDVVAARLFGRRWTTLRIPKPAARVGAWLRRRLPFRPEPLMSPRLIPFADDHLELDVSAARRWLGWVPKHRLRETLPLILARLRADPAGWYKSNRIAPPRGLARRAPPPRRTARK